MECDQNHVQKPPNRISLSDRPMYLKLLGSSTDTLETINLYLDSFCNKKSLNGRGQDKFEDTVFHNI